MYAFKKVRPGSFSLGVMRVGSSCSLCRSLSNKESVVPPRGPERESSASRGVVS